MLQRAKELRDIIAILGMDELVPEDKLSVTAPGKIQRFLSQPFNVAEVFTGFSARSFLGGHDWRASRPSSRANTITLPEQAFYMVGGIEEAVEKPRRCKSKASE